MLYFSIKAAKTTTTITIIIMIIYLSFKTNITIVVPIYK